MSRALVCDQCGETLAMDSRGDSETGEDAGWITLGIANSNYDLCTRSCVVAFVERADVIEAHEAWTESITGIAKVIRDGRDEAEKNQP